MCNLQHFSLFVLWRYLFALAPAVLSPSRKTQGFFHPPPPRIERVPVGLGWPSLKGALPLFLSLLGAM